MKFNHNIQVSISYMLWAQQASSRGIWGQIVFGYLDSDGEDLRIGAKLLDVGLEANARNEKWIAKTSRGACCRYCMRVCATGLHSMDGVLGRNSLQMLGDCLITV